MNAGPFQFSVVVPTRGRPGPLSACLQALARLDYPRELFEVIVVDDGGGVADETLEPFRGPINLTLVRQANAGPSASRNAGAEKATRAYLAFTDDDCQPEPAWLKNLAARLAKDPRGLIGGRTVNVLSADLLATTSQLLVDYLYHNYTAPSGQPKFFTTSNVAVSATLFRSLRGFDTTFKRAAGEDREFCARWRDAGLPMIYAADCVVRHAHAMNWRGFLRQHFNYGRAAFHYRRRRAQLANERVPVEPLSFYWNLMRFAFLTPALNTRRFHVSCLLCVSQGANALGYFVELAKSTYVVEIMVRYGG